MNFDLNNYEDHILDYLEGQLSETEVQAYEQWKAANPHLEAEEELMRQTFLKPETVSYSNKDLLKSFGKSEKPKATPSKVVPLYRKFWSLGLVAAAVMAFFLWTQLDSTFVQPKSAPIVKTPVEKTNTENNTLVESKEAIPTTPAENLEKASTETPLKEQSLIAGLNSVNNIGQRVKEMVSNNKQKVKKATNSNNTIHTKKPERFTKEDVNLDRRYNSTIVEAKPIERNSSPIAKEQTAISTEAPKEEAVASQEETKTEDAPTKETEIAQEVLIAEAPKTETQVEPTPAVAAEKDVAETRVENEKVLRGWEKVRASLQDENSVLGYAAREAADFVTPTILETEKAQERERRNISIEIKIAQTNLGKTIKKLRNK